MHDEVSKKFTNCKKRKIGGQLWVDSVYQPKNLAKNPYWVLLVLSLRLTEITPV